MSETIATGRGGGSCRRRPLNIANGWHNQGKSKHGSTEENTMELPKTTPRETRRKIIRLPYFLKRTLNRTDIREGTNEKQTDDNQSTVHTASFSSASQVRIGDSSQSEDEMSEMVDSHGPDLMPGLGLDKYSLVDEDDLSRIPLSHSRANEVGRLKSVPTTRRRSRATSLLAESSCSSDSDTRTNHSLASRDEESVYLSKTSNSDFIDSVVINAKKHGKVLVLKLQDADAVEAVSLGLQRMPGGKRSNYISYTERILEEEQGGVFEDDHDAISEEDEDQQGGIFFEPCDDASGNEDGIEQTIEEQPIMDDDFSSVQKPTRRHYSSSSSIYPVISFEACNEASSNEDGIEHTIEQQPCKEDDHDGISPIVQTPTSRQYTEPASLGPVSTSHPAVVSPVNSNEDIFDDDCTGPMLPDDVDFDDSVASSAAGNKMEELQDATTRSRRYDDKGFLLSPSLTPPRSISLKYSENKLNSLETGLDSEKSASSPKASVSADENDKAWKNMQEMIKKELSLNKRSPMPVQRFQSDFTRDQSGFSTMSDALYSRSTGSFADQTVGSYGSESSFEFSEIDGLSVTTDALRMDMPVKDELKAMAKEISAKGPVVVMKWLNPTTF